MGSRLFELPELKLLVDAVESSRFITKKKSDVLIHKLASLASQTEAVQLTRPVYMDGTAKPENETIYYVVDVIHTAIQKKQQIEFQYIECTPEKKKILKHGRAWYRRCPWARNGKKRIVWRCVSRLEFGTKYCHGSPSMKELPGRELPRVLAGEGYGIIEDCGGTGGLERLAEAFRQKNGDDYAHYKKWLDRDDLDLDSFDLDDMNLRLKKVPRIYTELYEYGCAPSQRSLDFLERKYQDNTRR